MVGTVCYEPNIRVAVTQIAYLGHVSMERTATLLADLLGCPVSTGFVASCLTRLADKLDGFEADLKAALAGADRAGYHKWAIHFTAQAQSLPASLTRGS